jgi:DNA-binding transcriptional LysR family regulator
MVERACGLAGYRPLTVAHSMDFAAQLAWVAAGVGVALVPQLATDTLPDGVRLIRLTNPVHRHIHAARRTTLHGDAGLDRITHTLRSCAAKRLNPT